MLFDKLGKYFMKKDFSKNLIYLLSDEDERVKINVVNILNDGIKSYENLSEINKLINHPVIDVEPNPVGLNPYGLEHTAKTIIESAKDIKKENGKGAAIEAVKLLGVKRTKSLINKIKKR